MDSGSLNGSCALACIVWKVLSSKQRQKQYIQFLAFLKIGFKISYRTVQGIVRGLSDYLRIEEIHFTQVRRRILKLKPSIGNLNLDNNGDNKPVTLIVDASGLTITKKGDYIEEKWIRKKKEFIKLHIAVESLTQRLGLIAIAVLSAMLISVTATQKSYAQSIVTVYNIQDVDPPTKTVKFTYQVLTDILTGKITKWNDPQIQAINPGENLPAAKIYFEPWSKSGDFSIFW